jgi:hypothetical protein
MEIIQKEPGSLGDLKAEYALTKFLDYRKTKEIIGL